MSTSSLVPRRPLTGLPLVLALVACLASAPTALAQSEDYVTVKTYLNQDVFHAGDTVQVAIEMRIDSRYHINANVPDDDFSIPTNITWTKVPETLALGEIQWPKPTRKAFEFTEGKKVPVLEGRQRAHFSIKLPEDIAPGAVKLLGTFKAQGCTHSACYAPQKDPVKVTIRVVPADEDTATINAGKFVKKEAS